MAVALLFSACASAPLAESGSLSSYAGFVASDGSVTKTRLKIDKSAVLAARSVHITPTEIATAARETGLTDKQLRLVTNAIDRAVCAGLSERFEVVGRGQPADLAVRAVVTYVGPTDATAAAVSSVVNIGRTVAGAATGKSIPTIRLPIGMGGLSVEAQANSREGQQIAAILWARGADVLTTGPRASEEADAYFLAKEFASDLSTLLVTGNDPIKELLPSLPSKQSISEFFGAKPKHAACEQFGRHPGLGDALGGAIGLPPAWTDAGPK